MWTVIQKKVINFSIYTRNAVQYFRIGELCLIILVVLSIPDHIHSVVESELYKFSFYLGSSPTPSRSNSPSPSSPAGGNISLTIPKSRSFSVANVTPQPSIPVKRGSMRERRSFQHGNEGGSKSAPVQFIDNNKLLAPLVTKDGDSTMETNQTNASAQQPQAVAKLPTPSKDIPLLSRRLNITSDYESNDSPSSSDHSDNVTLCGEDGVPGHPIHRARGLAKVSIVHWLQSYCNSNKITL